MPTDHATEPFLSEPSISDEIHVTGSSAHDNDATRHGPDRRSVRERLMAAAAEEFRSPDYPLFANVTLGRIARRAGVSERTAFRYLRASEVEEELPSSLLGADQNDQGWTEERYRELEDLLLDPTRSLADALEAMATRAFDVTLADPALRSRHAMWPYAEGNASIAESLADHYDLADRRSRAVINALVASASNDLRYRSDTLTIDELVSILTAVVDGIAMRASLTTPENDDLEFSRRTVATAFKVLIGALIVPANDDYDPTEDHLARLDAITGRQAEARFSA